MFIVCIMISIHFWFISKWVNKWVPYAWNISLSKANNSHILIFAFFRKRNICCLFFMFLLRLCITAHSGRLHFFNESRLIFVFPIGIYMVCCWNIGNWYMLDVFLLLRWNCKFMASIACHGCWTNDYTSRIGLVARTSVVSCAQQFSMFQPTKYNWYANW